MAEDGLHDLLAGHWRFRRHASTGERMQGEASFLPGPDGLRYHEEGVAILPGGQRFSFFRNYVYRIEGAGMTILFDGPSHGVFQQVALTRDGGARLNRAYSLHTMTDGRDTDLFYRNFEKITE